MAAAREIAIQVEHVHKSFRLPHEKVNSIKSAVVSFYRRKKTFEKQRVLRDVSFEIKKGEFFGIVGRNGSGKSTLLKLLAGIYSPDNGKIQINGQLTPFIELGVGFNPELTGRENVYLNAALLGFNRKEVDAMYDDIVEFAELARFMDQKLKNYSSGMQVRLAFSVAIRARTDILLIDEVLAVGDANFQRKCFGYFKELKRNGQTVVFVSHDMSAVEEFCDRAILVEGGEKLIEGPSHKVAVAYQQLLRKDYENMPENDKQKRPQSQGHAIAIDHTTLLTTEGKQLKVLTDREEIFVLTVGMSVNQPVKDPIFGITIHDSAGTVLYYSNTKADHLKTGSFAAKDYVEISWQLPNVFNSGEFYITPAVAGADAITILDVQDRLATLRVSRDNYLTGPLALQHTIDIVTKPRRKA